MEVLPTLASVSIYISEKGIKENNKINFKQICRLSEEEKIILLKINKDKSLDSSQVIKTRSLDVKRIGKKTGLILWRIHVGIILRTLVKHRFPLLSE